MDRYFTVLGRPNRFGTARLGLAVSKKACKTAVGRNRLKRTIRESFRLQQCLPAIDLVIMPRAAASSAAGKCLQDSLAKHWQEITTRCVP